MDNGFGFGTLVLVGLGCGALGFLSGVEEPLSELSSGGANGNGPETKPGLTRRSAKRAKGWVRDLRTKRQAKRAEKKAEKTEGKKQQAESVLQSSIENLAKALDDPSVLAELTGSDGERVDPEMLEQILDTWYKKVEKEREEKEAASS